MQQIFLIHGGHTHDSYEGYLAYLQAFKLDLDRQGASGWKENLPDRLGDGFEIIAPSMPCKQNAKYLEWKIWFEKHLPFLRDGAIFVGHSLGGLFLVKYLSENDLSVRVKATCLVAAPFESTTRRPESLGDFALRGFFSEFESQAGDLFLFHSLDDQVVSSSEALAYLEALPKAHLETFKNRGHFNNETFPELEDKIRELSSGS